MIGTWNIFLRQNRYYIRVFLRPQYANAAAKKEIWRSLRTGDKREAIERAPRAYLTLCAAFAPEDDLSVDIAPQLPTVDYARDPEEKHISAPSNWGVNAARNITLQELLEQFADDILPNVGKGTRMGYQSLHKDILLYFGEKTLVRNISRQQCQKFRNDLEYVVPGYHRKGRFKDSSLAEVARIIREKLQDDPTFRFKKLRPKSQNKRISHLKYIFNWAVEQELIDRNPAKLLRPYKDFKKSGGRRSFQTEELRRWFDDDYLRTSPKAEQHFWVTLIMLYTGTRLGEAAQLTSSDIRYQDNVPIIDITDQPHMGMERNIKTESAIRKIPVHPELIRFGLFDYAEKSRSNQCEMLFPSSKSGKSCPSWTIGKCLNQQLRRLNMTSEVVMHSFRHTFRDALRSAELPAEAVRYLGGWARSGADVADQYGSGFSLAHLNEFMSRVSYPGLFIDEQRPFLKKPRL
ncbi:MAG: tyrosine-type recombinase/integrase [Oceanospirillaceae bacterium]|nr:tyrosine-type recombinase/integrase [Oceanospirillaceae bacterium]